MGVGRLRLRRLKFVREQFFLAAAAQNIRRLVRFLSQTQQPGMAVTTYKEGSLRTRTHAAHGRAKISPDCSFFNTHAWLQQVENYSARRTGRWFSGESPMPLLQLRVFRLGFLQDGNVGVGVFPKGKEVLVGRLGFCCLPLESIGTP